MPHFITLPMEEQMKECSDWKNLPFHDPHPNGTTKLKGPELEGGTQKNMPLC